MPISNEEIIDIIRQSNPILVSFLEGTGGEFISSLISACAPSVTDSDMVTQQHTARFLYSSPIVMQAHWSDLTNPATGVYMKACTPERIASWKQGKRALWKDHNPFVHPVNSSPSLVFDQFDVYFNAFPNLTMIRLVGLDTAYWAKLFYMKVGRQKICLLYTSDAADE